MYISFTEPFVFSMLIFVCTTMLFSYYPLMLAGGLYVNSSKAVASL